jgi:hypothetical protein
MDGARIVDVFVSGNQVAIYTRNEDGVEALSIFLLMIQRFARASRLR